MEMYLITDLMTDICTNIQSSVFVCMLYVCLFVSINSAPLLSTQHVICILNQHDPSSALAHNLFALTLYVEKFLFDTSYEAKNRKFVQSLRSAIL